MTERRNRPNDERRDDEPRVEKDGEATIEQYSLEELEELRDEIKRATDAQG
jgi:hypothetical protein